jgi:uncharacterized membrane protein YgcG
MKNFTTKLMLGAAIFFATLTTVSAQSYNDNNVGYDQPAQQQNQYTQQQNQNQQYAQPVQQYSDQQNFYYYPDANVYYNPACNNYIYNDGTTWLTVNVLPYNIRINNLPRVMVYHRGPQVWLDNRFHRDNYYGNNYRFQQQPVVAYRDNNYRNDFRRGGGFDRGFDRGGHSFGGRGLDHNHR